MLNDPLADALSLIKNAEQKGKGDCTICPSSKLIGGVLSLLKEKGYEFKAQLVGSSNEHYLLVKVGA